MLIVGSVNKHYYDHGQTVYGWDTATVSLYANWGSIAFLAFMVPILYLQVIIHKYNPTICNHPTWMSRTLIFEQPCSSPLGWWLLPPLSDAPSSSSLVSMTGKDSWHVKQALPMQRHLYYYNKCVQCSLFTILCHVAAILNGIPGIVVASAPAAVSAAWFPPHVNITIVMVEKTTGTTYDDDNDGKKQERVTATSISQMLNNVGQGVNIKPTFYNCTISHLTWFPKVSFLIASLMVDEPSHSPTHHVNATSNNASLVASEVTKLKVVLPFQSSHSLFTKFSF